MACFAGGIKASAFNNKVPQLSCFPTDILFEGTQRCIMGGLGQMFVFEHEGQIEVFQTNNGGMLDQQLGFLFEVFLPDVADFDICAWI